MNEPENADRDPRTARDAGGSDDRAGATTTLSRERPPAPEAAELTLDVPKPADQTVADQLSTHPTPADPTLADPTLADLTLADLTLADLTLADLTLADLTPASLTVARNLALTGPGSLLPPEGVRVVAVLVVQDGEAVLPRTLAALAGQERAPDVVLAADLGSRDGSAGLLAAAGLRIVELGRARFGDAVHAALTSLDAVELVPSTGDPDAAILDAASGVRTWVWLLRQGSAPAPDALRRLLDVVDAGPSIGVAGCKQVDWEDGRHLLDVGFSVSRLGGRVTGVDTGDVDQGQLDDRSDVMAVSVPGMLVRRDLWDRLGGFDPALSASRDALDLCRRAHLAGSRVVVVPGAVLARSDGQVVGRPGRDRRRAGVWRADDLRDATHLRLVTARWFLLPVVLVWTAAVAVARSLAWLLLRRPRRAGEALTAPLGAVARPWRWWRSRRRARRTRSVPRRSLTALRAGDRQTLRQRRDGLSAYLREREAAAGRSHPDTVGHDGTPGGGGVTGGSVVVETDRSTAAGPDAATAGGLDTEAATAVSGAVISDSTTADRDHVHASLSGDWGTRESWLPQEGWDSSDDDVQESWTVTDLATGRILQVTLPVLGDVSALGAATAMLASALPLAPDAGAVRPADVPSRSHGSPDDHPLPSRPPAPARRAALRQAARREAAAQVEALRAAPPRGSARWRALLVTTVLALAGSVVALWPVLRGAGTLTGPGLFPAPDGTGALWSAATSWWRGGGLGTAAPADPVTLLLSGLSVLTGGSPRSAVTLLLLIAPPMAAVLAWWAAGALTRSRALRCWAAALWASAPSLLAAVASGRTGPVIAHLALPILALALGRTAARAGSRATASTAGLLGALVLAAAPALLVPFAVASLGLLIVARRAWRRLLWALAVPALLLSPWLLAVLADPRLLLADAAGPAAVSGDWGAEAGSSAGWWHLLLPADPGWLPAATTPPWLAWAHGSAVPVAVAVLLLAPLPLLAWSAMARRDRGLRVPALLSITGLTGLAVAASTPWVASLGLHRDAVRAGGVSLGLPTFAGAGAAASGTVPAWAGTGVSVLLLALAAAALWRLDGAAARLRRRAFGSAQVLAALVCAVVGLSPTASLGQWVWQGWTSGDDATAAPRPWLTRLDPDVVPAVAAVEATGPGQVRTLVVRTTAEGVTWTIAADAGPRLGDVSAASLGVVPARTDAARTDAARTDAARTDAARTDAARTDAARTDAARTDAARTDADTSAEAADTVDPSDAALVLPVLSGLLGGGGTDERARLGDLNIGSVLLLGPTQDFAISGLDASPGLVRMATPDGGVLWRVDQAGTLTRPARVRVLDANGATLLPVSASGTSAEATLPSGDEGRLLVLADRADEGWQATLAGRPLPRATYGGWAQAFELPPTGGRLAVQHRTDAQRADPVRLAVLLLALLLAVPLPHWRRRWIARLSDAHDAEPRRVTA